MEDNIDNNSCQIENSFYINMLEILSNIFKYSLNECIAIAS